MVDLDRTVATQLANTEKHAGKSTADLAEIGKRSGLNRTA